MRVASPLLPPALGAHDMVTTQAELGKTRPPPPPPLHSYPHPYRNGLHHQPHQQREQQYHHHHQEHQQLQRHHNHHRHQAPHFPILGHRRSHDGSPASLSPISDSPSDPPLDPSSHDSHDSPEARGRRSSSSSSSPATNASDDAMDTEELVTDDPSEGSGLHGGPHGGPPRPVPAPTWTNQWTSRAPPPRPLRGPFAPSSSSFSRRHHPYASTTASGPSSRGAATPSPTWPPHIGIDDGSGSGRPASLPTQTDARGNPILHTHYPHNASTVGPQYHHRHRSSSSSNIISGAPGVLQGPRGRSSTVILPRPDEMSGSGSRRPPGPVRTQSHGGPEGFVERERPASMAALPSSASSMAVSYQEQQRRRSRGDSFGTTDSSQSHNTNFPPSPLLFAPISPFEPFGPAGPASYGKPGAAGQPSVQYYHQQQQQQQPQQQQQQQQYHHPHQQPYLPPLSAGVSGNHRAMAASGISPLVMDRLAVAEESSRPHDGHMSPYEQARHIGYDNQRRAHHQHHHSGSHVGSSLRKVEAWQGASHPSEQMSNPQAANSLPLERFSQSRRRRRPPYSYSSLIAQAISSAPGGRMTLREIYTWISNAYPELYSMDGPDSQGWQNTVRHNLSLNKSFVKVARTAQDIYESCASTNPAHSQAARGKGGWWTIDPVVAAAQLGPNFRGGGDSSAQDRGDGGGAGAGSTPQSGAGAQGREGSPSGYSDEYYPSPAHTPSVLVSEQYPHSLAGPPEAASSQYEAGQQPRRISVDTVESNTSGSSSSPYDEVPSVLQRPRPMSLDQGSLLGFDRKSLSFGRTRGYTASSSRDLQGPSFASHSRLAPTPLPPRQSSLEYGHAAQGRRGHEDDAQDSRIDRDRTPKALGDGSFSAAAAGAGDESAMAVTPTPDAKRDHSEIAGRGPEPSGTVTAAREKQGSATPDNDGNGDGGGDDDDKGGRMAISGLLC